MTNWDWLLVVVLSAIYLLWCGAMALFMSSDVKAAEITLEAAAGNGFSVVTIKDKIDPGDDEKFKALTVDLSGPVLVALASKGGNVRASIAIGRTVRMKGWATMVRNGDACSSGCALVWLGGVTRYVGRTLMWASTRPTTPGRTAPISRRYRRSATP